MPYIPFTEEQKVMANSVDLAEFLRMRGEKLERVGREHKLIYYDGSGKHDSITMSGSRWFDHKNQVGGGAIKFTATSALTSQSKSEATDWNLMFFSILAKVKRLFGLFNSLGTKS